ncbi:MFS transporter [Rhodococcus sp. 077-4]|uniref:MFS transporter n=1 Tax=Rhodococcus sp. 077-4 TaxID=2789271 RepID=UPI0039F622C0
MTTESSSAARSTSASPAPPSSSDDEGGSGWSPRWIAALVVIVLLGELAAFAYNLVATALPGISASFDTPNLGWVITLPNLVVAVLVAVIGKLADLRGKRLVLVVVIALSALGAVISAVAPSYEIFLLGRGLQGLMYITPALGYSLIRDVFPKKLIAFAITVTFTGAGATFVAAPFLAGWLIDTMGALSIFWFLAIYQVVCIVGILAFMPESPLRVKSRLDWPGALMLGAGGAVVVFALGEGGTWGWTSARFIGVLLLGALGFVAWIMWDRKFPEPLIELPLLRSRPVWTTVLLGGFIYAATGIVSSLVPSLIQTPREVGETFGFGTDALGVAVYLAPLGAAMVISGFVCGGMARRWGIKLPMQFGCVFLFAGGLSLALWHSETWQVAFALVVFGAGMGATYGALPNLIVQAAPPEKQGITAAIALCAQNLGTAMLIQIAFGVLAGHLLVSGVGTYFSGTGYSIAFLIGAGCAVVSLAITFLLPHGNRESVLDVTTASDVVAPH